MKDSIKKEPIRLRDRITPSGRRSLYLDVYDKGRRKYEYLNLYLLPGNGRDIKAKNAETLAFAKDILAKRLLEFRNGKYGFASDNSEVPFIPYIEEIMRSRENVNPVNVRNLLHHIRLFANGRNLAFADITTEWVQSFKHYLDHASSKRGAPIRENTKRCYFSTLRFCFHKALADGIISRDPSLVVDGYATSESARMYLTLDELRLLIATPCRSDYVRRAFLFSCLTGLRSSDIKALCWGDVQTQGEFTRLIFRQKKTNHQEYLDITPQAAELLGERSHDNIRIFTRVNSHRIVNEVINDWVQSAGINKHITFHCARHTFATMMLTLGTDIYTVSKLLGHSNISTTQIYTKVIDKNKQEAVSRIPKIL